MKKSLTLFLVALGLCLAPALRAQDVPEVVVAFGDSITRGDSRFDEQNRGGYPGRLQVMMRRDNPDARVLNFGRDGETTAEGLSRVSSVLDQTPGADAFLLMEGTNDISYVIDGLISFESIESNLGAIGARATARGMEVFDATIIPRPPSARLDKNGTLTAALAREIRDLAFRQQNQLVDPHDEFSFIFKAFSRLYSGARDDTVGHPNAAGFAVLADLFYDAVSGLDTHGPVNGALDPGYNVNSIRPAIDIELTIYDLGAGIDPDNTTLTINGVAVETTQSGNSRRRILTHDTTAESLGCHAKVGIRAADLADPPNISDHVYKEFDVVDGTILRGDLNKSCRVDGVDLLIVALAFGSQTGEPRYSKTADLNDDGIVDGVDFALLANNFGRSS